jgi:type III secretion protein C
LGKINPKIGITPDVTSTPIPFQPNFDLGVIGDIIKYNGQSFVSLGSLLNALEQDSETSIVMTPKIIAQDSRKATIFSGQNVPFAGSFVSNSQSNASTLQTANIEYRDVGFSLSITPVLGNSEIITMDIALDNSNQVNTSNGATFLFPSGSATGITTSRTTMETTVHVPNKHFLILSGMVNNSNVHSKSGIPCLGGIPIIGSAFSSDNDTISNHNVVIFLRPTIINSLEDMKELSSSQEEYFRNQAGTPELENQYDESMELIKTPEDE